MKIAIYGGSFDYFHKGHFEIIKRLSKDYDIVLVIPTTIRYYKKNTQMFSFNERFETVVEKTKKLPNVKVLDIERNVDSDWRFINSLLKIKEIYGDNDYYVAMGSDSFQNFESWCSYETILNEVKNLVVFRRPGYEKDFPNVKHIYIEDMDMNISSTALRAKLKETIEEIDLDEMIDDLSFCKGYEDFLDNYNY